MGNEALWRGAREVLDLIAAAGFLASELVGREGQHGETWSPQTTNEDVQKWKKEGASIDKQDARMKHPKSAIRHKMNSDQ